MKKLTKLAALSAVSTAIISAPLTAALAYDGYSTKKTTESSHITSNYHHQIQGQQNRYSGHSRVHSEQETHRRTERRVESRVRERERRVSHSSNVNMGGVLAAGAVGLIASAIIGNVLSKKQQPKVVYQTRPQNQVTYQGQATTHQLAQQRGANWLEYCTKKYKTFNPETGTFRGNDGLNHVCRAPVQ
ncbi:hypothetical protein BAnh1_08760 [Bartonella australis AUST/NH1]|uniref:Lectin-like protein BA14k n=1 Tax=Bartonella australis (strain Aust/NH1) TaxID=1094489 RepID=M1NZ87_BARAA|nr:BA14K family protein [Bartonella australis]AGF74752.1 hypothetical protein BAnh1_08760 [Bartonella australis AUST/NH1]